VQFALRRGRENLQAVGKSWDEVSPNRTAMGKNRLQYPVAISFGFVGPQRVQHVPNMYCE
jgi:hypothetical protein